MPPFSFSRSGAAGLPPRRRRALGVVLLALAGPPACSRSGSRRGDDAKAAAASASAARPAPPRTRTGEAPWERARGGDALDLARLAEAEGAAGLAEALADPDPALAALALAALPLAPDGELALGPLCGEASRASRQAGPGAERLLEVAWAVVEALPRDGERLDPEGLTRCAAILPAIARDPRLPERPRALALSTLRALAERGLAPRPPSAEALGLPPEGRIGDAGGP